MNTKAAFGLFVALVLCSQWVASAPTEAEKNPEAPNQQPQDQSNSQGPQQQQGKEEVLGYNDLPKPESSANVPQEQATPQQLDAETSVAFAAERRSKRQAGIPPVCCTKDPCDPCATTPCIACPLCG